MIPFALVGSKRLHERGATVDAATLRGAFGTLFWELALGSGDRCPFWYWASPGKDTLGLTRVYSALDALHVDIV